MEKLKLELSVDEACALYRVLKSSGLDDVMDEHVVKDIMAKIKNFLLLVLARIKRCIDGE